MELAAHWHRCQNLPKKRVNTSLLYRERDDPVKERLANWQGLCILKKAKKGRQNPSSLVGLSSKEKPIRPERRGRCSIQSRS